MGKKEENELHNILKEFLVNGEWYKPVPEVYECMKMNFSNNDSKVEICSICETIYFPNTLEDVKTHLVCHKKVLNGFVPHNKRENLKKQGWEMVAAGKQARDASRVTEGKRKVTLSWLERARYFGLPGRYTDDYLSCCLELVDALVEDDEVTRVRVQSKLNNKWGKYG